MKKIAAVLLTVLVVLSLAACGEGEESAEERTSDTGNAAEDALTENMQTDDGAGREPLEESEEVEEAKILVVYFSATNTTEGVAEMIADSLSADIYEIEPKKPYTDADLDYHDDNSRTTIEMNDASARPAVSGSVEDIEQYGIVFIGYPIWLAYHNLIQCTQA